MNRRSQEAGPGRHGGWEEGNDLRGRLRSRVSNCAR